MTLETVNKAAEEALRFLSRVDEMRHSKRTSFMGSPETAAVRRASMDLTRALARLRQEA